MKIIKRILTACIIAVMTVALSACSTVNFISFLLGMLMGGNFFEEDISLEYTLTEEDLAEFKELAQECEEIAMEGKNIFAINNAFAEMMAVFEYVETQAMIGYLEYCQDQKDETALAHYTESEKMMADVRTLYTSMLKRLAQDSPIKDELFGDWSEEEMKMLLADTEKISALQLKNSEYERDFYALAEDENWSKSVNELYAKFVENNQKIAVEYGKDNYYAFAADMIYGRDYTLEERTAFRGYVAEYIVPLYTEVYNEYSAVAKALTETEKSEYTAVYQNANYLYGYMDSYMGTMNDKMYAMFERPNASIFANGENALEGAFTTNLSYFGQPIAYFGPSYQDVFTIVHEMGHYVSYYYFDNGVLPYDLAEVHSQGNEWMMLSYLEGQVSEAVHEVLCLERAINGLTTVLYATVVDHFEELVYTAETPVKADGFESVMQSVCAQYKGLEEAISGLVRYSPFEYAQRVALPNPVYYLSYATSELASMGLYAIAQRDGYAKAQEAYTLLQEGVAPEATFTEAVQEAGLLSPFAQQTYVELKKVFFPE